MAKEDIYVASRHMKRCSASLVIRRMQIKTTMRYHSTPTWLTVIKKVDYNQCCQGCGEIGALISCWWECKMVWLLWKAVWQFLRWLHTELLCDPEIQLLGLEK